MGFVPDDLTSAPPAAVAFLAQQLTVEPDGLAAYGARAQTRQDHLLAAQVHLGYRKVSREDVTTLADWLLERALEHNKPTLLYELTCDKLRADQLVRPGVTRLERLVWPGCDARPSPTPRGPFWGISKSSASCGTPM
jgi:hypothetical protein